MERTDVGQTGCEDYPGTRTDVWTLIAAAGARGMILYFKSYRLSISMVMRFILL